MRDYSKCDWHGYFGDVNKMDYIELKGLTFEDDCKIFAHNPGQFTIEGAIKDWHKTNKMGQLNKKDRKITFVMKTPQKESSKSRFGQVERYFSGMIDVMRSKIRGCWGYSQV